MLDRLDRIGHPVLMTTDYRAAAGLAAAKLTNKAAPGLYLIDQPAEDAGLFWVVLNDRGESVPIDLRPAAPDGQFGIVPLHDEWEAGSGLYLGPVEVEVDAAPGSWSREHGRKVGAITVMGGRVAMTANSSRGTYTFTLGEGATAAGVGSIGFPRWRLVQRDHRGDPIVLFEQG